MENKRIILVGKEGVRQEIIKILLSNLNRIATQKRVKETILLSKYILKLVQESKQECFEFCIEQGNYREDTPPDTCKHDIG